MPFGTTTMVVLALALGGCDLRDPLSDSPAVVPPAPARGAAHLTACHERDFPNGGGYDVSVRGMNCERAGQLLPRFGLSISRDDPREGIYDRGAWTCWSQLLREFGAQNVCWDRDGRILVYKLG